MLYLLAIILIAIPFAVNYQVDNWHEPLPGEETLQESNWPMKLGISLLAMLMTVKMFQLANNMIVRQPILKQNP